MRIPRSSPPAQAPAPSPARPPYLALDARQAAAAGLGVTDPVAATATVLPGLAQSLQLPLLLPVDLAHARSPQQGPPLPGRVGVQGGHFLQPAAGHSLRQLLIHRGIVNGVHCQRQAGLRLGDPSLRKLHPGERRRDVRGADVVVLVPTATSHLTNASSPPPCATLGWMDTVDVPRASAKRFPVHFMDTDTQCPSIPILLPSEGRQTQVLCPILPAHNPGSRSQITPSLAPCVSLPKQ